MWLDTAGWAPGQVKPGPVLQLAPGVGGPENDAISVCFTFLLCKNEDMEPDCIHAKILAHLKGL